MRINLPIPSRGMARRRGHQAATLIEALMASCILAIMGAAIMHSVNYGLFVMRSARENQRATQIIIEKSEAIRLYSWDQVTNVAFIPATFTNVFDPQSTNATGVVYYGTMAVSDCPFSASYAPNIRLFRITLNWTNFNGIPHQRELSTLVAKDGVQNYVY